MKDQITVKEFIEKLSHLDPNAILEVWTCFGESTDRPYIGEMFKTYEDKLVIDDGEACNSKEKYTRPLFKPAKQQL